MEISRDSYLEQLISSRWNGMVKIITDIRRCGKSYLLKVIMPLRHNMKISVV